MEDNMVTLNPDVFTKVSEFIGGNQIPVSKLHKTQVGFIRETIVNKALKKGLFLEFFTTENQVIFLQKRMTEDEKNTIFRRIVDSGMSYYHYKDKYLYSQDTVDSYAFLIHLLLPRAKEILRTKEYEEYVCKEWNNPHCHWR